MRKELMFVIAAVMLVVSAFSALALTPEEEFISTMATSCGSSQSIVSVYGYVYNGSQMVHDQPVDIFCVKAGEDVPFQISPEQLFTNKGFYYTGYANSGVLKCVKGDSVFINVTFTDDEDVEHSFLSNRTEVTCAGFYYNEDRNVNTNISVPEFTSITLALGIAGVCLGMVFLRKN